MIRRLVEAHYFQYLGKPNRAQIKFWLRELRTPTLLIESAKNHVAIAKKLVANRPLLKYAISGKQAALEHALLAEETKERIKDRVYWMPLRKELEELRRAKIQAGQFL